MSVHPDDLAHYQAELHNDLAKLTCEVARIAEMLALLIDGERSIPVSQSGAWSMTSYAVTP